MRKALDRTAFFSGVAVGARPRRGAVYALVLVVVVAVCRIGLRVDSALLPQVDKRPAPAFGPGTPLRFGYRNEKFPSGRWTVRAVKQGDIPTAAALAGDNEFWSADELLSTWGRDLPLRWERGVPFVDSWLGILHYGVSVGDRKSRAFSVFPYQVNSLFSGFPETDRRRFRVEVVDEHGAPCSGIPVELRSGSRTQTSLSSRSSGTAEFSVVDSPATEIWTADIAAPFCGAVDELVLDRSATSGTLRLRPERRSLQLIVENAGSGAGAGEVPFGAYLLSKNSSRMDERDSASPALRIPVSTRWAENGVIRFDSLGETSPWLGFIDWFGNQIHYDAEPGIVDEEGCVVASDWKKPVVVRLRPRDYASIRVSGLERVNSGFVVVTQDVTRPPEPRCVVANGEIARLLLDPWEVFEGQARLMIETVNSYCEYKADVDELHRGVALDLRRATLVAEVRVVDGTGSPVPGASLTVHGVEPNRFGRFPACTGLDGVAHFFTFGPPPTRVGGHGGVRIGESDRLVKFELADSPAPLKTVVKIE